MDINKQIHIMVNKMLSFFICICLTSCSCYDKHRNEFGYYRKKTPLKEYASNSKQINTDTLHLYKLKSIKTSLGVYLEQDDLVRKDISDFTVTIYLECLILVRKKDLRKILSLTEKISILKNQHMDFFIKKKINRDIITVEQMYVEDLVIQDPLY